MTPRARAARSVEHDDTGPLAGSVPPPPPATAPSSGETALPTTEHPPAPPSGRAGRNLGAAVAVGLSLGAVILLSLLLWRPAFLGVVLAAVLLGVVELTRALEAGSFRAPLVPLLAGFAVLLLVPADGVARVLVFIATVVCSDVGGYAAGVLLGKHPMAPSISPKKSWEGFAGSVAACVLLGVLVFTFT